nr:O-antigen ligase family protein [Actinomycetota bacterium]
MPVARHTNLRETYADLAATVIPIVLIVYLGLTNGGFDPVSRSVVGIAVWWIVLVGTAVNLLPAAGRTTAGRILFGVAAAFAAWTAIAFAWTDSDERTATELAQVSTYLGIFALALAADGAGRWRQVLNGVTAGIVIVCGIAVLSRMRPAWFPEQIAGAYLQEIEIESRLAYPINYSSALGAFAAIGLPLALAATSSARTIAGRAAAAGVLPLVALTLWLTTSSLSVPAAVIALATFLLLAPDRLPKLATLVVAAAGSAILFLATESRDAFDRGLPTPAAESQGGEMLVITLLVCAAVAGAQAGMSLLTRRASRPDWLRISRRNSAIATAVAVIVAFGVGLALGGAGKLGDEWEQFKSRGAGVDPGEGSRGQEILDFSGSGRYDFWESAVDANSTEPLLGIGPGTWDFWWLENGSYSAYVRDAHSLYLETLAELGIVGLILIAGLSGGVLLIGAGRAVRAPPESRLAIAAATAGCAAFVAGATVDWIWELGVLPAAFFALAAIACGARE